MHIDEFWDRCAADELWHRGIDALSGEKPQTRKDETK